MPKARGQFDQTMRIFCTPKELRELADEMERGWQSRQKGDDCHMATWWLGDNDEVRIEFWYDWLQEGK